MRSLGCIARFALAAALAAAATLPSMALAGDPWLDRVRRFEPGTQAGFGAEWMPRIVLGGPEGLGDRQGSFDVVSLGNGGVLEVVFADNGVVDGPGDDLVVFENAFQDFREYAFVDVSRDGREWVRFPWDAVTGEGLAGIEPVFASSANAWDPLHPASGGDRFDLADVGLDFVRFVRITDVGAAIDDPGNYIVPAAGKAGFDLDAAAAIHSIDLGCVWGVVREGALAVAGARVTLTTADGARVARRRSRADGSYRFCHLEPGLDYAVQAVKRGVGEAGGMVYVDDRQLRPRLDLVFR